MKEPRVTIIVLNWNGKELVLDCLKSLKKIHSKAHILVVDNGSTDGSAAAIESGFPQVEILQLEKNLGYAGGNNAGFEHIKKRADSEFIIFLNNDTRVDPDFVRPLLEEFSDPEVGQTVPKIYYMDHPGLIWFGGSKINMWTGSIAHEGIREKDGEKFNSVKSADYATGCCMCIRTEDFRNLGGFDESFSFYAEDVDLSLRINKLGRNILFVPESKVWHKVSASVGGAFSIKKLWRRQKGNWKLLRKHASLFQLSIALICNIFIGTYELYFKGIFKKKRKLKKTINFL